MSSVESKNALLLSLFIFNELFQTLSPLRFLLFTASKKFVPINSSFVPDYSISMFYVKSLTQALGHRFDVKTLLDICEPGHKQSSINWCMFFQLVLLLSLLYFCHEETLLGFPLPLILFYVSHYFRSFNRSTNCRRP